MEQNKEKQNKNKIDQAYRKNGIPSSSNMISSTVRAVRCTSPPGNKTTPKVTMVDGVAVNKLSQFMP